MQKLLSKAIQATRIFKKVLNSRINLLVIVLCLFVFSNLQIQGQTNQKSNSKKDSPTQTENRSQNKVGKIVVKEDEFANKKTTTLTEHSLSSIITITMKCVIEMKANRSPMEKYLDFATVEFTSKNEKREYDFEDEINFLVDGRSVKGNQVNSLFTNRQTGLQNAITTLGFDVLEKVNQGKEVKMKLGDSIYVLDDEFKKLIKEFIKAAQ